MPVNVTLLYDSKNLSMCTTEWRLTHYEPFKTKAQL